MNQPFRFLILNLIVTNKFLLLRFFFIILLILWVLLESSKLLRIFKHLRGLVVDNGSVIFVDWGLIHVHRLSLFVLFIVIDSLSDRVISDRTFVAFPV